MTAAAGMQKSDSRSKAPVGSLFLFTLFVKGKGVPLAVIIRVIDFLQSKTAARKRLRLPTIRNH